MNRKKYLRNGLIAIGLAFLMLMSSSIAYFSDYAISRTKATAGSVNISVDNKINLLNEDGKDILNPGDVRDVKFQVQNEGNKSVDTEVVITLTSSVPMSDNIYDPEIHSLDPYAMDDGRNPSHKLNEKEVYSSEYELYLAEDVVAVEGRGHYPAESALPLTKRAMNAKKTKIVYTLENTVLSGNADLDEQENEYTQIGKLYLQEGDVDYFAGEEYLQMDTGETLNCFMLYHRNLQPDEIGNEIVFPSEAAMIYDDYVDLTAEYYIDISGLIYYGIKNVSVSDHVKGFIRYNNYPASNYTLLSAEDLMNEYGITVSCYGGSDEYQELLATRVVSESEYEKFDETKKADYEKCADKKSFDLALLFDPNSSNAFQASNVCIEVEVRAKQHRNATAGWELIDTSLNSIIQDSIFTVDYNDARQVTLTGVKEEYLSSFGTMTEITIPEGVEVIPEEFFVYCDWICTVNLPSTLKEINDKAFACCTDLTSADLPECVEYIGEQAFAYTSLTNLKLPENAVVKREAFTNVRSLTEVFIPKTVIFDYCAFTYSDVERVEFEDGITEVKGGMFEGCENLVEVILPDSITDLGQGTFEGCTSLVSIELPAYIKKLDNGVLRDCTSLKEVVIPNGVVELYNCFSGCTSLESIVIPDSVEIIDSYTFYNCSSLKDVVVGQNVREINSGAFAGCTSLTSIELPNSVKIIDDLVFSDTGLVEFVIPDGVEVIDFMTFADSDNLVTVTIPDSVKSIGYKAFYHNTNTNMTIYTNNNVAKNYKWSTDKVTPTFIAIE